MHGGINRIGAAQVFLKNLAEARHRLTAKKLPLQTDPNISPGQFIEENAMDVRCAEIKRSGSVPLSNIMIRYTAPEIGKK